MGNGEGLGKSNMKIGDLVNNTHGLDRCALGIVVEVIKDPTKRPPNCTHKVKWINPPVGCPHYSWNSPSWLEVVSESR